MYSDKQLKYLTIIQQQRKSGKMTKNKYEKEISFVRKLNQSKKAVY